MIYSTYSIDADIAIDLLYAFATRGQLSERLLHMMLDALAQRPSDLSKLDDGCILKLHTVRLATEKTERATGGAGFTQVRRCNGTMADTFF